MRVLVVVMFLLACPIVDAQVDLSVDVSEGKVHITLDPRSAEWVAQDVQIVVTHTDPLVGTVVDRIIDVTLSGGGLEAILDALPQNVSISVDVINASVDLPLAANGTRMVQGALDALPILAGLKDAVHTPPRPGDDHPVEAYPVTTAETYWSAPFHVGPLLDGRIVFAWGSNPSVSYVDNRFVYAISEDGGRNWSTEAVIATGVPNNVGSTQMVVDDDIWFSVESYTDLEARQGRHISVIRANATTLVQVHVAELEPTGWMHKMALTTGGPIVVTAADQYENPGFWIYGLDGNFDDRVHLPTAARLDSVAHFHLASDQDAVVLAYLDEVAGQQRPVVRRSMDGGHTWDMGLAVPGLPHANWTTISDAWVDSEGRAIIALQDHSDVRPSTGPCGTTFYRQAWLARLEGPIASVQALTGPKGVIAGADTGESPRILVNGHRMWVFVEDDNPQGDCTGIIEQFALESMDRGTTWKESYRMVRPDGYPLAIYGTTLLADGTPAIGSVVYPSSGGAVPAFGLLFDAKPRGHTLTKILTLGGMDPIGGTGPVNETGSVPTTESSVGDEGQSRMEPEVDIGSDPDGDARSVPGLPAAFSLLVLGVIALRWRF